MFGKSKKNPDEEIILDATPEDQDSLGDKVSSAFGKILARKDDGSSEGKPRLAGVKSKAQGLAGRFRKKAKAEGGHKIDSTPSMSVDHSDDDAGDSVMDVGSLMEESKRHNGVANAGAQDLSSKLNELVSNVQSAFKPKVKSGRIYFVSTEAELRAVKNGSTVMLYGDCCPASPRLSRTDDVFAIQPPRSTEAKSLLSSFQKSDDDTNALENLYIWARDDFLETLDGLNTSVHFVADQFLSFGLRQSKDKKVLLVTGGFAGSRYKETNVDVWLFHHGKLVSFSQRKISPRGDEIYTDEIQTIVRSESVVDEGSSGIDEIYLYKDLDVERIMESRVEYIDFDVFSSPVSCQIRRLVKKKVKSNGIAVPALIAAGTACASGGLVYVDYSHYQELNKDFRSELSQFENDPSESNVLIERYESYRSYFEQSAALTKQSLLMDKIIEGMRAMNNYAYLEDLEIIGDGTEDYDFRMTVALPSEAKGSALEEGDVVLNKLASKINARLISEAPRVGVERDGRRAFKVKRFEIYGTLQEDPDEEA